MPTVVEELFKQEDPVGQDVKINHETFRDVGVLPSRRKAVLIQFLIESLLLSITGGIIGITLGAVVSWLLSALAGWSAIVTYQAVVLAFVFSASVGVVFGFCPARKASLLSPIEALRYE